MSVAVAIPASRTPGRWAWIVGDMKNIQVIDGAENCVYDIFAAMDEEFSLIFPTAQDVAFIGEVYARADAVKLDQALSMIWTRRVRKVEVQGILGTLFYDLDQKTAFQPTRCDDNGSSSNASRLR